MKVLIPFYSLYGHVYKMAQAVAEGAAQVKGARVELRRVPETLPNEIIEKMGAVEAQKALADIPVCTVDDLRDADAISLVHRHDSGICAVRCVNFLMLPEVYGYPEHWLAKWEVFLRVAIHNMGDRKPLLLHSI